MSHRHLAAATAAIAALALSGIALVPSPAGAVTQSTYTSTVGAGAGQPQIDASIYKCDNTSSTTGIARETAAGEPMGSGALTYPAPTPTGDMADLASFPVTPTASTSLSFSAKAVGTVSGVLEAYLYDSSFNLRAAGYASADFTTTWQSYDVTGSTMDWYDANNASVGSGTLATFNAAHPGSTYVVLGFDIGDFNCDGANQLTPVTLDKVAFSGTSNGQDFSELIDYEPTPTTDHTLPTVGTITPSAGSVAHGPLTISATASDNAGGSGINEVEFTIDGQPFDDYVAPYQLTTSNFSAGSHTLSVRTQDNAGNWSGPVESDFTYAGPDAPSAPTALVATGGNLSAQLTWTAPTNDGGGAIHGYAIETSTDGGATWSAPAITGSTATSYTAAGLSGGHSYVFRVAAVNAAGTGAYTAASAPVVPTGTSPGCASAKASAAAATTALANANAATATARAKLASLAKLLKKAKKSHNAAKIKKLTKQVKAQTKVVAADAAAAASAASAAASANAAVGSAC